jgi:hypothetical protein
MLRFLGIAFPALVNTQGIRTGTFRLHYRDELQGISTIQLAEAADATQTSLTLNAAGSAAAGDLIQLEAELMRVGEVQSGGLVYVVERGQHGSAAAAHGTATPVYHLQDRTVIVPFERNFFGTPAAGDWVHSEWLPDIRLASAEFFVTNSFGNSPATVNPYTELADGGQRTLHGGQFNFQIEGVLGILDDAAPPLSVQQSFSIRDVYAAAKGAPTGAALQVRVRQGAQEIATVSIADGQTASPAVNGAELPVLTAGSTLSLDILAVGTTYPGRDLTVTIRL